MTLLQGKIDAQESDRATEPARIFGVAQRVRVGLTGLAAIFLLVLVAAAGLRPTQTEAMPRATDEPLAVLGVAPGGGSTAAGPAVMPATVAQPPRHS